MAAFTELDISGLIEWAKARPKIVEETVMAYLPNRLYMMDTGHRCEIISYAEDGTVTVAVTEKWNHINFPRRVGGVDPGTLVECDLPPYDEKVGIKWNRAQCIAYLNEQRAGNGEPPLTDAELAGMHLGYDDFDSDGNPIVHDAPPDNEYEDYRDFVDDSNPDHKTIQIPIEGRGEHIKNMLLKVQRALETNAEGGVSNAPALVYNKDKSFSKEVPFEQVAYLFGEYEDKVYCTAQLYEGGLQMGRKVAPLKW